MILKNENKMLGKAFGELNECLEHRENYSVDTLA